MSETFIKEFNFSEEDMHLCDDLIEYHKNNMEYKNLGKSIGNFNPTRGKNKQTSKCGSIAKECAS